MDVNILLTWQDVAPTRTGTHGTSRMTCSRTAKKKTPFSPFCQLMSSNFSAHRGPCSAAVLKNKRLLMISAIRVSVLNYVKPQCRCSERGGGLRAQRQTTPRGPLNLAAILIRHCTAAAASLQSRFLTGCEEDSDVLRQRGFRGFQHLSSFKHLLREKHTPSVIFFFFF